MSDFQKLRELSVDDLLQELRAREAKAGKAVLSVPLELSENLLREFDDASIAKVLKENQKAIYGTDDRMDIFQLPAGPNLDDVDSVVALFQAAAVMDNGNGTSTLQTQNFGTARNLCAGERFREQPTGAFCSGFLVAPDIIATAGHCVNANNVANVRFVFGFRMRNATTTETVINNAEIFRGVAVIGRQEVLNGPDWALVRIDRPVTNHRIVRIRRSGQIGDTQAVHVIGHPSGLPTKFAGGAAVRDNQPNAFFVANLDTYGGNSGSPVFNSDTHEVEGILVRGESDFVQQGNCMVSLVCPTTGCGGEDCTRTTEFANLVPDFLLQTGTALHETDDTFAFALASNNDLFAIKKSNTGTHMTEVHVLPAASNYQQFILQTGTVLHETDATFEFLLAANRDLFAIKKSNTGSNSTEIHVLSAASNYKNFILHTGTALHETDASFEFALAPNCDLVAIKKSNTGTHSTEVHVLSASSNYQQFVLQTGTALHETDVTFEFALASNRDLVAIKKSNTGTHSTEVHVLSVASNYQQFILQTGTVLHETDQSFTFDITASRDLFAIKKRNTGTHTTEIHIVNLP
jgi:hypothetical protein